MYALLTIPRGSIREAMRPPVPEPMFGIVIRPPSREKATVPASVVPVPAT